MDSPCADGYEGPVCAICSLDYYKQSHTCKKFPSKSWIAGQLSLVAVISLVTFSLLAWKRKRKLATERDLDLMDRFLSKLKILGFYQVTHGLLNVFSYIRWPDSLNIVARYSGILQLNLLQVAPIYPLPFSRIKSECIWRLVINLIIECNRRTHFWCCLWYSQENYLRKKTFRRRTKKGKNLAYERDRVQKPLLHSVYNLLEYVFQDSQCSTVCLL